VVGTLLAFQRLGKMPADVYMRLTEVLRLKLSQLLYDLSSAGRETEARFPLMAAAATGVSMRRCGTET
jgi:hypothetical protein